MWVIQKCLSKWIKKINIWIFSVDYEIGMQIIRIILNHEYEYEILWGKIFINFQNLIFLISRIKSIG